MGATSRLTPVRMFAAGVVVVLSVITGVMVVRGGEKDARAELVRAAPVAIPTTSAAPPAPVRAPSTTAAPPVRVAQPCRGNTHPKEVLVSLADQRVWLCARHVVRADFPVTTGRAGESTPTGTYAVQALTRDTVLEPDSGGAFHVAYWIPFKWGMFGFHDAPWQAIPFGSPRYRTAGSHGCVHLRTANVARLFRWVALGTVVRVVARSVG